MFTRVLTRTFFLRRGSQGDHAHGGKLTKEPTASVEVQEELRPLQPITNNTTLDDHRDRQQDEVAGPPENFCGEKSVVCVDGNDENRCAIFRPKQESPESAHIDTNPLVAPSYNTRGVNQDVSNSFVLVNTADVLAVVEDESEGEEADEVFKTPSLDDQAFSTRPVGYVLSSLQQQPFVMEIQPVQTGMLSDITETEEPTTHDTHSKDPRTSPTLLQVERQRGLSFSSFGSSYPSSPQVCAVATAPEGSDLRQVPQPRVHVLLESTQPNVATAPNRRTTPPVAGSHDSQHDSLAIASECPSCGLEKSASKSPNTEIITATRQPIIAIGVVPAPSTYAEAMNLALQHPEMSSEILHRPLSSDTRSSAHLSTSTSRCPSPSLLSAAPNSAVAPIVCSEGNPMKRTGAPHTTDRPNWALAPDEATPKATRQSRPRGRGRGRGSTRPPSSISSGERRDTRSRQYSVVSKVPPVIGSPPAVATSLKDSTEAWDFAHPSFRPKSVQRSAGDLLDGPEQWLKRVNSWVEQTAATQTSFSTATPGAPDRPSHSTVTSPPFSADVLRSSDHTPARSRSSTNRLNPHAAIWEPTLRMRQLTMSEPTASLAPPSRTSSTPSPALGPFRYGVDADIEHLRRMLHGCGIQDNDASFTTTKSPTPGMEKHAVLPEVGRAQKNVDGSMSRAHFSEGPRSVRRPSGFLDLHGTLHEEPEIIYETPVPSSQVFQLPHDKTSLPRRQSPPRRSVVSPSHPPHPPASFYRAEPGGPWIGGCPQVPVSPVGASPFPQSNGTIASSLSQAPFHIAPPHSQSRPSSSSLPQPDFGNFRSQGGASPTVSRTYKDYASKQPADRDALVQPPPPNEEWRATPQRDAGPVGRQNHRFA